MRRDPPFRYPPPLVVPARRPNLAATLLYALAVLAAGPFVVVATAWLYTRLA